MGTGILVFGDSGSGKSASLRNCHPEEWGLVNVMGKPLPFKSGFKPFVCADTDQIVSALKSARAIHRD
jgi:hypothetical protein